ncbi:MAG: hypothetical protein SFV81_06925 [Pirellulaceae bacterium]|nr:hypothetical protein [Pirellulaceae bacterium]
MSERPQMTPEGGQTPDRKPPLITGWVAWVIIAFVVLKGLSYLLRLFADSTGIE